MKSNMTHTFSQVPKAEIPRSTFNRTHGHKTAFDAGLLIPFFVDEALPGDTFSVRATLFARLATPIFPIMDNMFMDTQFFAVPMRLIWNNWEKFMGQQDDPGDSTDYLAPHMVSPVGGYAADSIFDYMGLPTGVAGLQHQSAWLRAYNLIYNTWYRDQNLIDSIPVNKGDGPDLPADYTLQRRGKRHDYFTSSLPWPQKGESITIPLGTKAPLWTDATGTTSLQVHAPNANPTQNYTLDTAVAALRLGAPIAPDTGALYADLTNASAATINQLRQSFQVQKMLERDARSGTRYTEKIKAHFGVTSPDSRLQRPEYLGGGSQVINVTQVPQTSHTDPAATPQGNLAAYATSSGGNHGFTKSFTEHCVLIGIVSVRADLNYQQGLDRMWSRESLYDWYWPSLSHIGEQSVSRKEIYATGVPASDEAVFGYQERYAEYRYKPSKITGRFRSQDPLSLDAWHLAQEFGTAPVLDKTFISEFPPIKRVIAVQTQPDFLFDSFIQMRCARPMPVYGVPGLIDHF